MERIDICINRARKMRDFILDLIFPIECIGCGRENNWLCQECFSKLKFNKKQYCFHCKKENNDGRFCGECQENYLIDQLLIAGDYNEKIIAELIKRLKYRFVKNIAEVCGKYLATFIKNNVSTIDNLKELTDPEKTILIPVPLHKKRLRWRGFNQSELIAERLSKIFDLKIDCQNLIRIKNKKPQAKLNEKQRKINLLDCFLWKGNKLNGKKILLIDDVATTGSTLNECAKILKKNGADKVFALVIAKG